MRVARQIVLLFLIGLFSFPAQSSELAIRFREAAVVAGGSIVLGDIADLSPASDLTRALADQSISRAPEPGEHTLVQLEQIRNHLVQTDSDLQSATWSGAPEVKVTRSAVVIGNDEIREILNKFLQEKRSFMPPARIRFKELQLPPPFALPEGELACEVIPSDPRILGSRRFTLIFRVDGRVVKNLAIRGELEAVAPVVLALSDLSRGNILSARDIGLAHHDLTGLRNPCFDPEELVGKRLMRSMKLGEPIDRGAVDFPPLVRRGQLVNISVTTGRLLITATGIAQANGKEGDLIKVRNTVSQREVVCRVLATGEVRVEF